MEDVGNEVQRFGVGDEVVALFSPGDRAASFQDFAVVEERVVAKKPEEWSWEEGASLGFVFLILLFLFSPLVDFGIDSTVLFWVGRARGSYSY